MDDTLLRILKDCHNKIEIIDSIGQINYFNEFSTALRKYLNEIFNEKQKLTTLYQQCMQDKFNIENEYKNVKIELNDKNNIIEQQGVRISNLENDLKNTLSKVDDIKQDYDKKFDSSCTTLKREYESLKSSNNLLISEKNELLSIITRKDIHIQQLDDQWKENVEKLKKANSTKSELQAKLDEYTQNGTLNEWRKKFATQQSEIYENQIKQHLETISTQSNDIIKLKKQVGELNIKIQTGEDQKTTEINHLNDTIKSLKKHLEKMQENHKKLIDKASHNESLMNMEKLELEKEVSSSHRLCELLTDEKNDLTSTINKHREIQNEFIHRINELEKDNSKLMDTYNENSRLWNENVQTYESKIQSLQDELVVAQTIVESSRINDSIKEDNNESMLNKSVFSLNNDSVVNKFLSPLAKSTSQLLKNGLSITQIYTEYNKSLNSIQDLKSEIAKISTQLNTNQKQLEIKNNEIIALKEEKNRCELYADHLSKNIVETNGIMATMEEKITTLENENTGLLEQKLTLTQLNQDLSYQIRNLLLPNDSNFNKNFDEIPNFDIMDDNCMSGIDDAIESTLVFKTVEQLQNQNMKLLILVKSLKKKVETLKTDPKTEEEYEKKLDDANRHVNSLSERLAKVSNSYSTIKKQLDIFMVASNPNGNQENCDSKESLPIVENSKNSHSFDVIRQQYQDLLNNKMELLNETRLEVSRLNDHANHLKSRVSQLESQLQNAEEQRIQAVTTLEHETREYLLKEQKITQVELLNKQLQESINFYRSHYDELSEKMNRLEQAYRSLSDENIHLRETSKFLESQLETHNSHSSNFGKLLTCIQDLQNNLEYRENSSEIKMTTYVDELKEEIKTLRFQLKDSQENNEKQHHIDLQKLRNELKEKEDTINSLLNRENEICSKLNDINSTVKSPDFVAANGGPLSGNDSETIKQLNEQLQGYKVQIEQILAVSAAAEENLEKNVQAWNDCKSHLENELSKLKLSVDEKNNEIEKLNGQILALENKVNEKDIAISQYETQQNIKMEPVLRELDMIKEREKSWESTKDHMNDLLRQLRGKYEMELIGHADDITSLKEITKKYEDMEKRAYRYDTEVKNLKCKFESLQTEYNSKINEYETAINDRNNFQKSTFEQNTILSNQVDLLMKQIASFKDKNIFNVSADSITKTEECSKSIEELWELIKYLRRDKEVLEARLESQKSENIKYKIKCERLETGCQNLEASLVAERSILNESNCTIDQIVKLKEAELLNSQLNGKIKELESLCTSLEEKLQVSKCESKELKDQLTKQNILSESTIREVNDLKTQVTYLEKMVNESKLKLADVNRLNNELKDKLTSALTKESTEKTKIEMFNTRLSQLNDEIGNLRNKVSEANSEKERAITDKDKQINVIIQEKETLNAKLINLEAELKTSIKRNQSLHKIASHLKNEISTWKSNDVDIKNPSIHSHTTELSELEKNLLEFKNRNSHLEDEIKHLKQKLIQSQDNKMNLPGETSSNNSHPITISYEEKFSKLNDRYEILTQDYNKLKQRHELVTKHMNEMYKKTENTAPKVVTNEPSKPLCTETVKPISIRDRISDTPSDPNDPSLKKTSFIRISPPREISVEHKCTKEELVPNQNCFGNVELLTPTDDVLPTTEVVGNSFVRTTNNSSTPVLLRRNISDIPDPSLFSEIRPQESRNMNEFDSTVVSVDNTSTKISPPSRIISKTISPLKKGLNRSLVRRKTLAISSLSSTLRNPTGLSMQKLEQENNETICSQDNSLKPNSIELNSTDDSQVINDINDSDNRIDTTPPVMLNDYSFKRPQKRNRTTSGLSTGLFIDDSVEFSMKKSNIDVLDNDPTIRVSIDTDEKLHPVPVPHKSPSKLDDFKMSDNITKLDPVSDDKLDEAPVIIDDLTTPPKQLEDEQFVSESNTLIPQSSVCIDNLVTLNNEEERNTTPQDIVEDQTQIPTDDSKCSTKADENIDNDLNKSL